MKNNRYRQELFLHMDGISILPILYAFKKLDIIEFLYKNGESNDRDISNALDLNQAYLNVCLRSLSIANILCLKSYDKSDNCFKLSSQNIESTNTLTKELNSIQNLMLFYSNIDINKIKNSSENSEFIVNEALNSYTKLKHKLLNQNSNFFYYYEGLLVGPLLSYLGFYNLLNNPNNLLKNNICKYLKKILIETNLYNSNNDITNKGIFFISRASSYGVTTSYLSTFKNITNLLKNNHKFIWERKDGYELHVNRALNVWGSGGAHKYYFNKIDDIIIKIFNKNILEQPKGIIDIGCGDGTFLKHIYKIILTKTVRGKKINKYPIKVIGVDINKAARIESRKTLNSSNINNIIINGNISDPEGLSKELKNNFNENIQDFLSCRTFLDHNRIYKSPETIEYKDIKSTGAFCYKGIKIDNLHLVNNLISHLRKWKFTTGKFGLIILELHTINPEFSQKNSGKTLACAYDTTHGLSDQYLVEYDVFIKCAKIAGFSLNEETKYLFPNKKIPTISISQFI